MNQSVSPSNRRTLAGCFLPWMIALAVAPPSIHAEAVNAASYRVKGMPGYGVAQGSIFALFGTGMGPSALTVSSLPLQANLAGTTVTVTIGSAKPVPALVYYTSAAQVACVLPSDTPVGDGTVEVQYNSKTALSTAIHVVPTSFGIFTRNQAGTGPGIIQNYPSAEEVAKNALNFTAMPNMAAVIWGTGLGPIAGSDAGLPPVGNLPVDVTVLVGGKPATILYKGRSPQFPGLDQINILVPPDTLTGCYVPVAVKAGGVVSNYTSMAISSDGLTCSDTASVQQSDIDAGARNGYSFLGMISLNRITFSDRFGGLAFQVDEGRADFKNRFIDELTASRGINAPVTAPGTCTAVTYKFNPDLPDNPDAVDPGDPASQATPLVAGTEIALQNPLKVGSDISWRNGYYSDVLGGGFPGQRAVPLYISAGVFKAAGGEAIVETGRVGTFQAQITLPEEIVWTNVAANGAVSRSADLTLTWSGGDPSVELAFLRGLSTDAQGGIRGEFACIVDPSLHTFTVPADVLSTLPVSSTSQTLLSGMLEVGSITRMDVARFSAVGLDGGYFQARRTSRVVANYK